MEAVSSIFSAFGVTGYDALDDLAHWLDGDREPADGAEAAGWAGRWADQVLAAAGREG
jgi:hypothetical protein